MGQDVLFTREEVIAFLPHRDPFLFIDTIDSISFDDGTKWRPGIVVQKNELVGLSIVASYFVKEDLPLFQGHFPGNPVLPGVIQLEMMAQPSCFILAPLFENPLNTNISVALVKIEEGKFRRPVLPGKALKIHGKCVKVRGNMMSFNASLTCEGQTVSECKLMAGLQGH